MASELMTFENETFGSIRTMNIDGEPWFVAVDVCNALEISNSRDAVARLDDDEKNTVALTDGIRGNPNKVIVNEPGLYSLVLGSRKPEAKAFKRWITHEVIPSIRKHGGYIAAKEDESPEEIMAKALVVAQKTLEAREKRLAALAAENEVMKPKAEYFDSLVERNTLTNFRETAKELHIPPKAFVDWLLTANYLYRDKRGRLLPYENMNDGLFEVKECANKQNGWSGTQTLITPKGREAFRLLTSSLIVS